LTSPVQHFHQVLKTLREARGLSQRQLADAAGVSDSTVRKAEQNSLRPVKRSTSIALLRALNQTIPMSALELKRYINAAGLESFAETAELLVTRLTEPIRGLVNSPEAKQVHGLAEAVRHMKPDEARAVLLVVDLMDRVGASPVLKILEAAAAMHGHVSEQEINVVHPPVNKGTHVEQTTTHYGKSRKSG
jgi:transcriptional regulator with XRE-family HTH domain